MNVMSQLWRYGVLRLGWSRLVTVARYSHLLTFEGSGAFGAAHGESPDALQDRLHYQACVGGHDHRSCPGRVLAGLRERAAVVAASAAGEAADGVDDLVTEARVYCEGGGKLPLCSNPLLWINDMVEDEGTRMTHLRETFS